METQEISVTEVVRKRGFWLSAILILMFITNPLFAFTYFSNPQIVLQYFPKMTLTINYLMGFAAILYFVFAMGIWTWKKWGVYGYYIVTAIAFCLGLYIGLGIADLLIASIGVTIIFFTTKSRWEHFS